MPASTKPIRDIELAIGLISDGLTLIDQNQDALSALDGSKSVDITARLNAQYGAIGKLITPLKERLKSRALSEQTDTLMGESYQASIKKVVKTVLDTEKIKKFFARRLPQFQTQREEVQIGFDVKT